MDTIKLKLKRSQNNPDQNNLMDLMWFVLDVMETIRVSTRGVTVLGKILNRRDLNQRFVSP